MIKAGIRADLKPSETLNMKLCEFNWFMENNEQKRVQQIEDIISLAWYTAYFQRIKKLESLEKYLKKLKKQPTENKNEISIEQAKEIYNRINKNKNK